MENSMKITVGLGSIDEYERFVQAGADEFFCGYVPFSWAEKYGTVMPLNRREVLCCNVQLGAYSELEILSRMVKNIKSRCISPSILCIIFRNSIRRSEIS